jgi:hypothetical protein
MPGLGPIAVVALFNFGGEGEIRTHETREGLPVFKSDDSIRRPHRRLTVVRASRCDSSARRPRRRGYFPRDFRPDDALGVTRVLLDSALDGPCGTLKAITTMFESTGAPSQVWCRDSATTLDRILDF